MKKQIITTIFAIIIGAFQLNAQTMSHKEIYDQDFTFTDGIYLKQENFKNNNPIEKSQISSNLDIDDLTYFEQLMQNKKISIYDKLGNEIEVETNKIFGFCSDGTIYINSNGIFSRVGIIGSICHFQGYKPVYRQQPITPYGYYGTFYSPMYTQTTTTMEAQQYIYNFETGQILEYNSSNMEIMLMGDPKIHDEYAELTKRKKNQKLFYYMRLYNEKHPLYIPVYE